MGLMEKLEKCDQNSINIKWHDDLDVKLELIATSLEEGKFMEAGIRLGVILEKNIIKRNSYEFER